MDSPKHLKTEEIKSQLKELIKRTLQESLEAELEGFRGYTKYKRTNSTNSRNGYHHKELKTQSGQLELKVPRDRNSEFEPKVVKKRQSVLEDLQDKIIALYSKGMTTRDNI